MAAQDLGTFATRIEARQGRALSPDEIFQITRARENALSRLLMLYIGTGLAFMVLPGTFLGVWNLISISTREAAQSVSASWIQAHGHAQIYGWIGSFILGIGFYSLPKLRRLEPFAMWAARLCWALWTLGVALRWITNVYQWHWRLLVPVSASLELMAFAIFFYCVSGHQPPDRRDDRRLDLWAKLVIGASFGMMLSLLMNLAGSLYSAIYGDTPAFAAAFDHRYLVLTAWGFLVPFVWGFSAKWLPVFLGLQPMRRRLFAAAAVTLIFGIALAMFGLYRASALLLLLAALLAPFALRLFNRPQQPAKLQGVHFTLPMFVRIAYLWSIAAAVLGIWAAFAPNAIGVTGASRHALTVGFLATMVFCVGQRILPAFSGMRLLFNTRLMFAGLALLTLGCLLRVSSEVLAYQGYLMGAWRWLPVSAVIELAAVTIFAINLAITFACRPAVQLVSFTTNAPAVP